MWPNNESSAGWRSDIVVPLQTLKPPIPLVDNYLSPAPGGWRHRAGVRRRGRARHSVRAVGVNQNASVDNRRRSEDCPPYLRPQRRRRGGRRSAPVPGRSDSRRQAGQPRPQLNSTNEPPERRSPTRRVGQSERSGRVGDRRSAAGPRNGLISVRHRAKSAFFRVFGVFWANKCVRRGHFRGGEASMQYCFVPFAFAIVTLTNASVTLTNASVAMTNASVAMTNTSVPLTNAIVPLTNASVPLTNASVPLTNASVTLTNASVTPTNASVAPTNASVALTNAIAPLGFAVGAGLNAADAAQVSFVAG